MRSDNRVRLRFIGGHNSGLLTASNSLRHRSVQSIFDSIRHDALAASCDGTPETLHS